MSVLSLYAGAMTLAAPGLRLMLAGRQRRGKEMAARLAERWGEASAPRPEGRLLWLHAASVGETVSVLPLLAAFTAAEVLVTTGTVTSAELLARRLPELGLAGRVRHRFVPLDVPGWVARFLDHWRPDAACLVESEIWPNLLRGCAARRIPLALANARLSPRSHARWARVPGVARALFGGFAAVHAQSPGDAARLAALGAPPAALIGNLKYAAPPLAADEAELARLRGVVGWRPLWLAASTHPGEDAAVREVHRRLAADFPGLLTILVPRHPERGAAIAAGNDMPTTRRGLGEDPPAEAGMWIGDTLGELGLYYRLAGLAFMGKSLGGEQGGQNPLEPARLGCAVAGGPAMQNFADIAAELRSAGGLAQVADAAGLAAWVAGMLRDPAARTAMGAAGMGAASRAADLPEQVAALLAGMLQ
jgi:3-deoxy-D-manno-octulosonic-acid transferase